MIMNCIGPAYTLRKKGTEAVTMAVPFQKVAYTFVIYLHPKGAY